VIRSEGILKDTKKDSPHGIVGVIPARYRSKRLPGKVLELLGDRTVLHHVHDRAAVMTSATHRSGTDRVEEAIRDVGEEFSLVVNIQADEPFVAPATIDAVARALCGEPGTLWTAVSELTDERTLQREDVVKAVVAQDGRVLYFSRAPIPHRHGHGGISPSHRHHVGIYGYSTIILRRIVRLMPSPLEEVESLEQLRALENGIVIRAVNVAPGFGGIDTREDLERARRFLANPDASGGGG
jgi:3-deoxy-manno-octulosonate cytidylyltransferase (CMP-KDO synthetase)